MSVNQWRVLNQIKDYVSKLSDKSLDNTVNKEVIQFLQQIQKSYVNNLFRYFESDTDNEKQVIESNTRNKFVQANNLVPVILHNVKRKIQRGKQEIKKEIIIPPWKKHALYISKSSITSRTSHVISSIITAENEQSLQKRIEDLSAHIKQYPEAKNNAVKEGALKLLLEIRNKSKNENIKGSIREACTLLGYADPLPRKGIRILSIDGGGIRGLLVLEMLKKLEELTGMRVYEMFDFFCGVSTGAILAYSLAIHHKDLDLISKSYKDFSTQVFTQSTIKGTSSLVWSQSYYDTALWEKLLRKHLGDDELISTVRNENCGKLCAVSAVVNQSQLSAYVFRNYSLPWGVHSQYVGGSHHKVWEAARASAAAPTYFEEFKLGNLLHQDGGILVNNPTAIAIHEAKLLWPNSPIQCVISFGTGRTVPNPSDISKTTVTSNSTSWANKFMKILDSATDTEGVHIMLNDLLPGNVYYRFNPYLTEMLNMTEIDPKKLEMLERDAVMYLRRNEDKFQEAAKNLIQTKPFTQKVIDWINLKRDLYGMSFRRF